MEDLSQLDNYYKKFASDYDSLIPDGIYPIDLELLHAFNLLHFHPGKLHTDTALSHRFLIVESAEKITLVNSQFIIWITPNRNDDTPFTCVLIALNRGEKEPQLEAAFIASGIYNSSPIVVQVLEKFLAEIQETESVLSHFKETG